MLLNSGVIDNVFWICFGIKGILCDFILKFIVDFYVYNVKDILNV